MVAERLRAVLAAEKQQAADRLKVRTVIDEMVTTLVDQLGVALKQVDRFSDRFGMQLTYAVSQGDLVRVIKFLKKNGFIKPNIIIMNPGGGILFKRSPDGYVAAANWFRAKQTKYLINLVAEYPN